MITRTRRFLGAMAIAGMACATAIGTELNVAVLSGGSSTVNVLPGGTVNYEVELTLGDAANEGLALILFDLSFDGGDLASADTPTQDPMLNFTIDAGITNPVGFGGTVIGGDLIQVGGAQNTINNYVENAPYPIGTVITGVGQTAVTVATGSLTAPMEGGPYTLGVMNLAGSVIRAGETGDPFWATELATVGTVGDLTITLLPSGCQTDEDCDDGEPCTGDTCDPENPESEPDGCVHDYHVLPYGDLVHWFQWEPGAPQQPDLDDILCVLDGFAAGPNWADVCPNGDVKITSPPSCGSDGQVNLDDILGVLDSFAGNPPCDAPCP